MRSTLLNYLFSGCLILFYACKKDKLSEQMSTNLSWIKKWQDQENRNLPALQKLVLASEEGAKITSLERTSSRLNLHFISGRNNEPVELSFIDDPGAGNNSYPLVSISRLPVSGIWCWAVFISADHIIYLRKASGEVLPVGATEEEVPVVHVNEKGLLSFRYADTGMWQDVYDTNGGQLHLSLQNSLATDHAVRIFSTINVGDDGTVEFGINGQGASLIFQAQAGVAVKPWNKKIITINI